MLLLAGLSLTPWAPGGPHPVWTYAPGSLAVASIDPYATLVEMVKLVALAAAFVIGAAIGADDDRGRRMLRTILLFGALYSAWAFLDHALNPNGLIGQTLSAGGGRLPASFGSPNTAATLFGALTLLNLVDLMRSHQAARPPGPLLPSHLQRLAPALARPLIALGLSAVCLVETLSRAGIVATFAVAVVLVGVLSLWRARSSAVTIPLIATLAIAAGLVLASVAVNSDALGDRLATLTSASVGRSQIFAAHWQAVQAAPWSGYGLGSFQRINTMIMSQGDLAALERIGAAHNVYLQWLEEAGFLGAAAMFLTVVVVAVQLLRGALRRRHMRGWILAILAVLALFAVHGATDYALQTPSMALFLSLLLGVGLGLSTPHRAGAE